MKKNIFLLLGSFVLFFSTNAFAQDTTGTALSPKKFERKIKKQKAVLLDVRTTDEFKNGHIPNATNYNVLDSANFIQSVQSLDKDKKYFLYCRSGGRSGKALVKMKQMGFENVYHLAGGITAWKGETIKP